MSPRNHTIELLTPISNKYVHVIWRTHFHTGPTDSRNTREKHGVLPIDTVEIWDKFRDEYVADCEETLYVDNIPQEDHDRLDREFIKFGSDELPDSVDFDRKN